MIEIQESQESYKNNEQNNSPNVILPLDTNINLPEEKNKYNELSDSNIKKNNKLTTKQQLSISLLNLMKNDPNNPRQEKMKISELIENVKNNNYYHCLSDLNGANQELMTTINQNQDKLKKLQIIQLPNSIDYDIDFYKIGKKCQGIKRRYAIIKNGKLFSSKKPLKNLAKNDRKALKDKTRFLIGAEIISQTIDNQSENEGEWSDRSKKYRIRIDYLEDKNKNKYSSFFMYFNNKKQLNEVNSALFNISKKDNYRTIAKNTINNLKDILITGNKFYTILKILSVKKMTKNKQTSIISTNINLNKEKIVKKDIEIGDSSIVDEKQNLYSKKKSKKKMIVEKQFSNYMPLISNISSDNEIVKNKISLNDLTLKINELKNIIPNNIINEINDENYKNGICFVIGGGLQINNYSGNNTFFKLDSEKCRNVKYIFFDKNKPEIIFKESNNENNKFDVNILTGENIFEISNILKNSSNNLHVTDENNLIILGPKINNDIQINYKYKNKDISFTDPEHLNIKRKAFNPINTKLEKCINLQIFKKELDIQTIKSLLQSILNNSLLDINNPYNLLFSFKIKLSPLKYIESPFVQPNKSSDNIINIEYNKHYFIPIDYFNKNQEIIIEIFFIPLSYINNQENNYYQYNNNLSLISKYLSPIKIGYTKIYLKNLKEKRNKYEIFNDYGIPIINSFIYLDGTEEKIEGINIKNNIEGKDYSIGSDSYVIKYINKSFIQKIKDNNDIDDNIKKKYFNVHFDSKNRNEFLFRPNENMNENDFVNSISKQVPKKDVQKIIRNKKYNYLPYCEMFIDRETLYKSQNLSCLSEEQKNYIINNYNQGQWIYKMPEIKVRLLSKNLGIIKNTNQLFQKLYCTGEEQVYPLEVLNEYNNDKIRIIPISENNFNIFDFKEMHNINFDNFQWKASIKFNNYLQMESFIKLINLAKQNINSKKKLENNNKIIFFKAKNINELSQDKNILYSENNKEEMESNCEINIEFIEFIHDFKLINNPNILEAKLCVENIINHTNENDLNENNQNQNQKLLNFRKSVQFDKNTFNKSNRFIDFRDHLKFYFDREKTYKLIINFGGFEFFTPMDIRQALYNKNCNSLELPLYKKDEQNNIYARISLTISEIEPNSKISFQTKYEENNMKYLREPLLIIKESLEKNLISEYHSKNNHFGLYEPNVFRRRILKLIHNNKNINLDLNNLGNYDTNDLKKLYQLLFRECVILPDIVNFPYFQFSDIKRNNDINDLNNSYRKKIGLELLRIKKHNEFMQKFRENKWELYLKKIYKEGVYKDPYEYFASFENKKDLFKNRKDIDNLQNLMYSGAPSKSYRQTIYSLLLDLPYFFNKTKEIIYNKYKYDSISPQNLFNFFSNQLYEDDARMNIIFSLIDNDSNFISSIEKYSLEEINTIKKIAKSFFIWAELRIGLNDKDDRYVYFIGLLSLTHKLLKYFEDDFYVFWILIGLAKNITHFHQKNPLFSDEMNYINIYGLVTKLIMERHQNKIYDKFISLNIPPELFISRHLSTFFTDYFDNELMMRIFDIIIFESSFQNSYSDNMQYLRILCAIPLTLFEFNEERILACKSVSEIESIINDLNLETFNIDKFIARLSKNINKFYVISGFIEKWFNNNQGREWDSKRGEIENLIKRHFYPVYNENRIYLYEICSKLKTNSQNIIDVYYDKIDKNMKTFKSLYLQGKEELNNSNDIMAIGIQISKLKQIYNNENSDLNEYNLIISFSNIEEKIEQKYSQSKLNIKFDTQNNEIINIDDLFYKNQYPINQFPKYIHFSLLDNKNICRASFTYNILNYEIMKISKIILENKEETNKYFLEFILFKFTALKIPSEELSIYNFIFSPPEYFHSKKIEEKLYSYIVSNNSFNKFISELINNQNNNRNSLINGAGFDQNMVEIFKKMNNNKEKEDNYNPERIKFNNNKKDNINIDTKIFNIIETSMKQDLSKIIKNWLNASDISIEEIFYGIILVDKSLISINDKLHALYSLGQLKDKYIYNIDEISLSKVKEMIYSLYKRFRIYFTKTDVERMIDFLLKDEKLVNIKYAFVHGKKDMNKINDIIYDKDYYESNINKEKKEFEIYFDEISKELIIYLNHSKNHFDINTFSSEFISYIFTSIINKKDINKYKQNNFDLITLVIEKENILTKRYYNIVYSPTLNIKEVIAHPFFIKPKDDNDILNCELSYEISNIDLNNSYNKNKNIDFYKFKEIFFKLPYLSDLFRVSFSYLNKDSNIPEQEFKAFKVIVGYEGYSQGTFYFPQQTYEDEIENEYETLKYDMNYNIKISNTVDTIIKNIIDKINDNKIKIKNDEAVIVDYLKSFNKIECYIWYEIDEYKPGKLIQEKIGYFDNLYSLSELKRKNQAEMHIIFNNDVMTLNSNRKPIQKEEGYCKIYYSTNNDFIWKKCKIKRNNRNYAKLISADYKSLPRILNKNDDILLAYDI